MTEERTLVPCYMLMVQSIAADIDDGGEGDADFSVRWGDAWDTKTNRGSSQQVINRNEWEEGL